MTQTMRGSTGTREFKMIAAVLRMCCRRRHGMTHAALCADCAELYDYAYSRLERCVFGEAKLTCADCTVHCYKTNMRERIRQMMCWAGQRMQWHYPVIACRHEVDGFLPAPTLQRSR